MGKKRKRAKPLASLKPVKSRRHARELTTKFHKLTAKLDKADGADPLAKAEIEKEIEDMGGRRAYQDASILSTSMHKTSRWVFQLLTKFLLRPAKGQPALKLLEVGAINTQLVACPWMEVDAIDLNSVDPKIRQIDFFDLEPHGQHDVVVSSMVINCVPDARARGRMLRMYLQHLRPGGHLFLMLPLLCLTNSNFVTIQMFEKLLVGVGFEIREKKQSPKIAFYCLQAKQGKAVQPNINGAEEEVGVEEEEEEEAAVAAVEEEEEEEEEEEAAAAAAEEEEAKAATKGNGISVKKQRSLEEEFPFPPKMVCRGPKRMDFAVSFVDGEWTGTTVALATWKAS
jgi:25S rRNA (adenine2142-N1)-methyltransferase